MIAPIKIRKKPNDLPITQQVHNTIRKETFADPVARQYLPSTEENIILAHENTDPIGDNEYSPVKGIVHRHADRALLKITNTCAVYCRFCFRKDMVGKGAGTLSPQEIDKAIAYIKSAPQVREVILTGGDPLTLSNRRLKNLIERLQNIDHLDIIRIHTRVPIVHPERINSGLLDIIKNCSKTIYIVLHVNHAQEINETIINTLRTLSDTNAILLSQSVLLKGINNNLPALEDLFRTLINNRVKPYYLHHPDLAPGTGHFRVSIKEGQALMKALRRRLSGLCIPSYVLDIPGGYGKVPIESCYLTNKEKGQWRIKDQQGKIHFYENL